MGVRNDMRIREFQKSAGIKPPNDWSGKLLEEMSKLAFTLIKVIELEKSGIRDGDGTWIGSNAMDGITRDMTDLCNKWLREGYRYEIDDKQVVDNLAL